VDNPHDRCHVTNVIETWNRIDELKLLNPCTIHSCSTSRKAMLPPSVGISQPGNVQSRARTKLQQTLFWLGLFVKNMKAQHKPDEPKTADSCSNRAF
jgi:hypothetical protein